MHNSYFAIVIYVFVNIPCFQPVPITTILPSFSLKPVSSYTNLESITKPSPPLTSTENKKYILTTPLSRDASKIVSASNQIKLQKLMSVSKVTVDDTDDIQMTAANFILISTQSTITRDAVISISSHNYATFRPADQEENFIRNTSIRAARDYNTYTARNKASVKPTHKVLLSTTPLINSTNKTLLFTNSYHKYHNQFVLTIGILSLLGLLLNFSLLMKICSCDGVSVIVLLGICLMLFNILMALYGIAMTVYLYKSSFNWGKRFCQGFTSVKLFSLGSAVWSLIMLSFHNAIRESTDTERDAVFKGIVYVLEGVMISGVLAVLSWIKLDSWDYLCNLIEPKTTVEWLLSGIEVWHYFIAILLIIRFPCYVFYLKKKINAEILQKRSGEFQIFAIILASSFIWLFGFTITLPQIQMFDGEISAVVRLCSLLIVIIIQPTSYTIRGTFICKCTTPACVDKNQIKHGENVVLLVCECSPSETCSACEDEIDGRKALCSSSFVDVKNGQDSSDVKVNKKRNMKDSEKKIARNKNNGSSKKKKNKADKTIMQKVTCRSPDVRNALQSNEHNDGGEINDVDQLLTQSWNDDENNKKKLELTPIFDVADDLNPPKALPDNSPMNHEQKTFDSSRNRQNEFPSFISLKTAINVDELPKEKKILTLDVLQRERQKSLTEQQTPNEERVSRGPTFYSVKEYEDDRNKQTSSHKNTCTNTMMTNNQNKDEKRKKKNAEKKQKKKTTRNKLKSYSQTTHSTESLEWDYSSGSSLSGENSQSLDEAETKGTIRRRVEGDSIALEENQNGPVHEGESYATNEDFYNSAKTLHALPSPTNHSSTDLSLENKTAKKNIETFDPLNQLAARINVSNAKKAKSTSNQSNGSENCNTEEPQSNKTMKAKSNKKRRESEKKKKNDKQPSSKKSKQAREKSKQFKVVPNLMLR